MELARPVLARSKRVVVKVGTRVVTREDGRLALARLGDLVEQIVAMRQQGREVLLVSSGAVGVGMERLGLTEATAIVDRQACAAAGQGALVRFYSALFDRLGVAAAQVLLTEDDFQHRRRYLNVAATLQRLLDLGAVPILNENDTVSTAELALQESSVFGDNDGLSALVASNLGADLLVLLTNVDGLRTAPPGAPGSSRIKVWGEEEARLGGVSAGGRGGMSSKVAAARKAARAGVHVVIADGQKSGAALAAAAGEDVGTWFPAETGMNSHRRWLAFATNPVGRIVVNQGARDAMVRRNASLLPKGVLRVEGRFDTGAVVSLVDETGYEFGRGISSVAHQDVLGLAAASGKQKPVVHRDKVAILEDDALGPMTPEDP